MDRSPVQEDLYEFHHIPGSTSGTYWRDVRAVIAGGNEAWTTEASSSLKGFPPIPVPQSRVLCPVDLHTPGYHGDSPTPQQGLPPITDDNKLSGGTTRPPDDGQNQLFFKKTDFEKKRTRLLDKQKPTQPINRSLIEAIEEPSAWKKEKKKRIENAIERVNNNYVVHPRNYQEPDINGRVDSQFMPTPPKGPKPKPRKNNRVILNPEKMLRDRDHMRGDFAPGRPPGHVPESCHRRTASQMPTATHGHAPITAYELMEGQGSAHVRDGYPPPQACLPHGDAYQNVTSSSHRRHVLMANRSAFDQGQAWREDHHYRMYAAQERIQQEYVDELRMDDEEEQPTSSQAEIDLDIKRQKLLSRKRSKKRKETAALEKAEFKAASEYEECHLSYMPAPPPMSNTNDNSYSKRKRHLVREHAHSTYNVEPNMERMVTEGTEGSQNERKVALIPRSTRPSHGPVIRVEPQLTWNAAAAKRGLGFKSKLRREQEEAALQNKSHDDSNDAPRGVGTATPTLSEEARRRWKNKTIYNQH